ncbi:tetratricopeptide repeat protein [Acinetobacter bereziniae]|uniref:tetratricopeptide repeat protein n=1 Tax=Acinetobacter bereziniae TaxID=106648 RepID=UPI0021D1E23B|nr:tetratricopeptide repeat protein [Acinetobacter bereziniae]
MNKKIYILLFSILCFNPLAQALPERTFEEMIKRSEQGDPEAIYQYADFLLRREDEASQKNGAALMLKSAQGGFWLAFSVVGDFFKYGFTVKQDPSKAVEWYKKSAEQDDPAGQNNLGLAYYTGEGISQNKALAAKWYQKSAEQGDANAQRNLALMNLYGDGITKNEKQAFQWMLKSAEQGDEDAQNSVGQMYLEGKGVAVNVTLAMQWLKRSEAQGNRYAHQQLWEMCNAGRITAECVD